MFKIAFNISGYILTIASLYYIYNVISEINIELTTIFDSFTPSTLLYLLTSATLYILVLFIGALVWIHILNNISDYKNRSHHDLINAYAISNIGKYIPGNIMQFLGRNILGKKLGYSHSMLTLATVLELILLLLSSFILLTILYFFSNIYLPSLAFKNIASIISIDPPHLPNYFTNLIISTILIIILFIFYHLLYKNLSNKTCRIIIHTGLIPSCCVVYIFAFLLLGLTNLLVFSSLNTHWNSTPSTYCNILFAFVLSWIIGLLTPGSPGGIGIREAVFIFLLSTNYDTTTITIASVLMRFINIFGDTTFAVLNMSLNVHYNKRYKTF